MWQDFTRFFLHIPIKIKPLLIFRPNLIGHECLMMDQFICPSSINLISLSMFWAWDWIKEEEEPEGEAKRPHISSMIPLKWKQRNGVE